MWNYQENDFMTKMITIMTAMMFTIGDNFLPDGEEIICPDCAKEKLMGPQAQ